MKSRCFLVIVLLLHFSNVVYAQDQYESIKKHYLYYWQRGFPDSAIHYAYELKAISRINNIDPDRNESNALRYLANCLNSLNISDSAFHYINIALKILSNRTDSSGRTDWALALNTKGNIYSLKGNFKESQNCYETALTTLKESGNQNTRAFAGLLNNLGNFYSAVRKNKEAIDAYSQSLNILKNVLDSNSRDVARTEMNLGILKYENFNYEDAFQLLNLALTKFEALDGNFSDDYVMCKYSIANIYMRQDRRIEAIDLLKALLNLTTKFSPQFSTKARIRSALGICYLETGDLKRAFTELEYSLSEQKRAYGTENENYIIALSDMAAYYRDAGFYEQAMDYYEQALQKAKNNDLEYLYAFTLSGYANLLKRKGEIKIAEKAIRERLKIFKGLDVVGENHFEFASSLNNLGEILIDQGKFEEAESVTLKSLSICEELIGTENSEYFKGIGTLAMLYQELGQYQHADSLYLLESQYLNKIHKTNHPDIIWNKSNRASIAVDMERWELALNLYDQVINDIDGFYGSNHPEYAKGIMNKALVLKNMERFDDAELFYQKAIEGFRKKIKFTHPDLGIFYSNFANLIISKESPSQRDQLIADSLYKEGLKITEINFGKNHPSYLNQLLNYAQLKIIQSDFTKMDSLYNISLNMISKQVKNIFSFLSESERQSYWQIPNAQLTRIRNNEIKYGTDSVLKGSMIYQISQISKNALLNTSRKIEIALQKSKNLSLIQTYTFYKTVRKKIGQLWSAGSNDRNLLQKLDKTADSLDKVLTKYSAVFRNEKLNKFSEVNQMANKLSSDEIAIEFIEYSNIEKYPEIYYGAVVLGKNITPTFLPLCSETTILNLDSISSYPGELLYPQLWEPLEKFMLNKKTAYVAPIGYLNILPINAMRLNDTSYLGDKISIRTVLSLQNITQLKLQDTSRNPIIDALLVGGVNYDSKFYEPESKTVSSYWEFLPGSLSETLSIQSLLTKEGKKTTLLRDTFPTEERIKRIGDESSPSILHLATHGFYNILDTREENPMYKKQVSRFNIADNPLLRCGLILCGANKNWNQAIGISEDDGILTGLEVSDLRLEKTKMVILSACETGLGEINGDEGVFGLKRAFHMSGAQKMIISLWKLEDEPTAYLMKEFYKIFLKQQDASSALKKAQQNTRLRYKNEVSWAGLILVE
jgi:CHAT domain-containing protein/tetratricopeptide (TPR) repeat protein